MMSKLDEEKQSEHYRFNLRLIPRTSIDPPVTAVPYKEHNLLGSKVKYTREDPTVLDLN